MRKYSKEHQWALVEGDKVFVGITNYAAEQLGDVVFVEMPAVGDQLAANDQMAVVESVKTSSDVYAPVSGEVLEINEAVVDEPEKLNAEPEGKDWMVVLTLRNPEELNDLMSKDEYLEFINGE
ncbi:MAG: glycine cleavage system protein GcvH [Firmicutes bacterium]|nr:glycine cleavage system protein GcvH [Bacillota bacterium]